MINVHDLSFEIENKFILKNIDLVANENQVTGIIGPNGSGKSTLLKCIYGTTLQYRGNIFFDGQNLKDYTKKKLAQSMAVVAQQNIVNFDFTVMDMVLLGRSPYKRMLERENDQDRQLARQMLAEVELGGFENRIYTTLSGGEQQRVVLARALTQDTPCIVLDEPTNHMDIKHQLQFLSMLKKSKKTILVVLHDLNLASMFCDYIYLLDQGQIKAAGSAESVLTSKNIRDVYHIHVKCEKDEQGLFVRYQQQPE